ncbi:MAG: glycoside hydrolase family 13 protein [Acutalibacteraceae bacterium]|nr:glycoside hydrolase family 13 protein [Acutalibacteraceae bacterium]
MQYYPFDSRNPLYRSKIGAVASGENLKLRLLLHNDAYCHAAYLVLSNDFLGTTEEIPLKPAEWLDNYQFWDCELNLDTGLYWYYFRYESRYGEFFVTKCAHSTGFVSRDGKPWQQTVYNKDYKTPDWLSGGIIYQIFPDRFYNSGKPKKNIPSDRFICDNWDKKPEHRQNNGPCSLSNDYYGGDLAGITEKLPYIASLGVNCIYLNPIFEAHSNHRYNTADYMKIDPHLGDTADLKRLCKKAEKLGIKIILDGVFSHTGDDSVYFNKYNRYNSLGAYTSQQSPYYNWFKFENWPEEYEAWWGITTLPEVKENNAEFTDFITGNKGVIKYWLNQGVSGWRLDVADELPDEFIENIRRAMKQEKPDSYLLGEVWEDASNKISYGARRKFLHGDELDSVMNYPYANAIVDFMNDGNACRFVDTVLDVTENYPPEAVKCLMNHIGTHDTARILTRLGKYNPHIKDRNWQATQRLNKDEYENAVKRLKSAATLQFTVPGVPSVFYGDEAGIEGYNDPFCRATYPWGKENNELLDYYRLLGEFRRNCSCLKTGEFIPVHSEDGYVVYMRRDQNDCILVGVNTKPYEVWVAVPDEFKNEYEVAFGDKPNSDGWLRMAPNSPAILKHTY